jgi:hypothetical protein
MFRKFRLHALPVALLLAACSGESPGDAKEVADLRTELQRTQQVAEKQREQISALERRLAGLAEDVARVRKASADVVAAATAKQDAAAAAANAGGDPANANANAAGVVIPNAPAMKAFFESEDGKKTFAAALKTANDQTEQDRANRTVDNLLARLAKEANLTDDQSKKMKDILGRSATQLREIMQSMRDGQAGGDPGDIRQKFTDLRTTTETEAKAVLSQTQFETFQKIIPAGGGMGGFGGFGGGRPRGGNNNGGGGGGNGGN